MDSHPVAEMNERATRRAALTALALLAAALACVAYRALAPEALDFLRYRLDTWFFQGGKGLALPALAVCTWMLHRRRHALRRQTQPAGASGLVAAALLAAAALLGWGTHARAPDLVAISLIFTGLALALAWGGAAACRVVALPLAALVFTVALPPPLYNAIVWKLQLWTGEYVAWLAWFFGREPELSGDLLFMGRYRFHVIESCSGLRLIELLTLLSLAMAELLALRRRETLVFVAAAPLVAFAVNGFRGLAILLAPASGSNTHHIGQGILMLAVACLLQYGLGLLLTRLRRRKAAEASDQLLTQAGPVAGNARFARWLITSAVGFGMLATVSVVVPPSAEIIGHIPGLSTRFPKQVDRWESTDERLPLVFMGATRFRESLLRIYRSGDQPDGPDIELFVGIGAREDRRTSPFGPKTALPGPGWMFDLELDRVPGFSGASRRTLVVRMGEFRRLVYHFTAGDLGLVEESWRALSAVDLTSLGRASNGVVARLSTPLPDGSAAERQLAEKRLDDFVKALHEPLALVLMSTARSDPAA